MIQNAAAFKVLFKIEKHLLDRIKFTQSRKYANEFKMKE